MFIDIFLLKHLNVNCEHNGILLLNTKTIQNHRATDIFSKMSPNNRISMYSRKQSCVESDVVKKEVTEAETQILRYL